MLRSQTNGRMSCSVSFDLESTLIIGKDPKFSCCQGFAISAGIVVPFFLRSGPVCHITKYFLKIPSLSETVSCLVQSTAIPISIIMTVFYVATHAVLRIPTSKYFFFFKKEEEETQNMASTAFTKLDSTHLPASLMLQAKVSMLSWCMF